MHPTNTLPPATNWVTAAITKIEADYQRSADTHLIPLQLPAFEGVDFYFKDESTHPSGSLKHRLSRSLFLYGLCNGWIHEGTTVVEASSGSTAVSEAYFARLLGLPFIAVMPKTTSQDKVQAIEFYGGKCHFVNHPAEVYDVSRRVAEENNGHFMDQFTYAERATDWRGNNNIAESIFRQMQFEAHPVPTWIVVGAGTGGTSATLGRYVRYERYASRICVVDPENSVFYDCWQTNDPGVCSDFGSRIEGIGRPRVEPSFIATVVDHMIRVPDAASFAAMKTLSKLLNRRVGGSTGTNFWGALQLAQEMKEQDLKGSIVTLICDSGERYQDTYYNDAWLSKNGFLDAVQEEERRLASVTGLC
ncbi:MULTISPECIES: PLP-dependent cysteine synthase family protein [Dyadobacter]|uniref:L-cysteine desulfhydrase Cds1 n=1 Tax=Dyadobacter chenhuakuii TaxID=2909339 RepID=A0A9X1TZ30_9BACT|nr:MULTISPECIES: PLP-dependent cysteine synthase family protein [Dyadobacter]MCF2492754.1 PLP-dependent cysteine synthase family protein [Dyadobacter chenhuakuii]MCF2496841.1 PLP-dependent cysteine synthase family protein [Dyadobacter chenhuakuii]MCF2520817.1 PLP-dependent cysteine synthase family protein [Dyadobacter sp. CY351]USJ32955.1 PLP-dependent cysteine synthase family protein [Dyadobacter chenhuakuii]